MARVYIETTIIGYLASRPRNDVIFQARRELTRIWWDARREQYEIVVSQLVLDEAGAGDEEAAARRLELLSNIPLFTFSALLRFDFL